MLELKRVEIRIDEGWLTTDYFYSIATYTWRHAPPRTSTIKYFVFITNRLNNKVTLIHSSLCVGGIYFDINIDSSR